LTIEWQNVAQACYGHDATIGILSNPWGIHACGRVFEQ
jgi:hypothetical protein